MDCGRVESSSENLEKHYRLRGGRNSSGENKCTAKNIHNNIILGTRFTTDFTEIRIKGSNNSFIREKKLIYTLGVILTKSLAEHLAIEQEELSFGIKSYRGYKTIFIYDIVKGGAGYASKLKLYIEQVLKLALKSLEKCSCVNACTRCLIDRDTQWNIEDLDRKIAIDWLDLATKNKLPKDLQDKKNQVSIVYGTLQDEIKRILYHYGIKEINIHINNKISKWNSDKINWAQKLKIDGIKEVNFIIEGALSYSNNQEKLSIYLLLKTYNLKKGINQSIFNYKNHLSIKTNRGKVINYISEADYTFLSNGWANDLGKTVYKVEKVALQRLPNIEEPSFDNKLLFESSISDKMNIYSNDIAKVMSSYLVDSNIELKSKFENQIYVVSYIDKYNQSEFTLRLLLQFVDQLKSIWNFDISNLNIHQSDYNFNSYKSPDFIIHSMKNKSDFEKMMKNLSADFDFETRLIDDDKMPHYRYFKFTSDKNNFNIRIDGGIGHGLRPSNRITSNELPSKNEVFKIYKNVNYKLIYNISIEN